MDNEQLPEPECELGYTENQVKTIVDDYDSFCEWMGGQTMGLCVGKQWNREMQDYEQVCNGVEHGYVIYEHDLRRYLS